MEGLEFHTSEHYTAPEIDQRLLQGYYDDAVAAGYPGTKDQFLGQLANMISAHAGGEREPLGDVKLVLSTSGAEIQDGSIDTAKLANLAVTTAKIAAGAIDKDRIADNAVTTSKIRNGEITWGKLATTLQWIIEGLQDGTGINDNAITMTKLAQEVQEAISKASAEVGDGSITTAKLEDNSVTSRKIADKSITLLKLAESVKGPLYQGSLLKFLSTIGGSSLGTLTIKDEPPTSNVLLDGAIYFLSEAKGGYGVFAMISKDALGHATFSNPAPAYTKFVNNEFYNQELSNGVFSARDDQLYLGNDKKIYQYKYDDSGTTTTSSLTAIH